MINNKIIGGSCSHLICAIDNEVLATGESSEIVRMYQKRFSLFMSGGLVGEALALKVEKVDNS